MKIRNLQTKKFYNIDPRFFSNKYSSFSSYHDVSDLRVGEDPLGQVELGLRPYPVEPHRGQLGLVPLGLGIVC
jgi:hypothetical protein